MSGTSIVVELTPDEEKLLAAFRKIEAADTKMRADFAKSAGVVEASGGRIADAMIKAGKATNTSFETALSNLKKTGDIGRKVGGELEQFMTEFGLAGRKAVDDILNDLEKLDNDLGRKARQLKAEYEAADRTKKFDDTTKQLEELGGKYAILAKQIRESTKIDGSSVEEANRLVAELRSIDPSKAEQIANAMQLAGDAVRATNFDQLVASLNSGDKASRSLAETLERNVKIAAFEAAGGVEAIAERIRSLKPELSGAIDQWKSDFAAADQSAKFDNARQELGKLGAGYEMLAKNLKAVLEEPMEGAKQRANEIISKLQEIDPSKAEAFSEAVKRTRKEIDEIKLKELVNQLVAGSNSAKELAKVIGVDMQEAALAAQGGIDGIAQQIIALRPEMAASVEKWKAEMTEAAKFGEGQYEKVLDTLRSGDPVARKTAEAIRRHLVDAGQIVERSFEDMIKPLEDIDPVAAEQARKLHQKFSDMEESGKGGFENIRESAVTELAQVVTAYVGVQEAIQFVTDKLQEQQQVLEDAAEAHKTLAASQQEAAKSLATLPAEQRDFIIRQGVESVSKEANFADLSAITTAFGEARAAGASYEQMLNIVPAAANITGNTPDQLPELSASILDSMNATGIQDAKQNINLALIAGGESRVADPIKTVRNMAPVQAAGANQAGVAGALEGMAMFAALSNAGVDRQGDSTQTASIQFIGKMNEFFSGLDGRKSEAMQKLADHKQVDPLTEQQRLRYQKLQADERNKATTDASIIKTQSELDAVEQQLKVDGIPTAGRKDLESKKGVLKDQLSSLKKSEFGDRERAELSDMSTKIAKQTEAWEAKRTKLQKEVADAQIKGWNGPAPKLPSQQLAILQQDENLKSQFLENPFGEQRFRPGYEQLLNRGKAFEDFQKTLSIVKQKQGQTDLYDNQVEFAKNGTPQMAEAYNQRSAEAAKNRRLAFDSYGAQGGSIRNEVNDALRMSRPSGLKGVVSSFNDGDFGLGSVNPMEMGGALAGAPGAEENVSAIHVLAKRLSAIREGGVTEQERPGYLQVESTLNTAMQRMQSQATLQADPEVLKRLAGDATQRADRIRAGNAGYISRENADVFLRLESILKEQVRLQEQMLRDIKHTSESTQKTSENTKPAPPRVSDAQTQAANDARMRGSK